MNCPHCGLPILPPAKDREWPPRKDGEAALYVRMARAEQEIEQLHRMVRDLCSVTVGTEGAAIGELAPKRAA